MTETEEHAGVILGGMHQRREWATSLWSGTQPDWARRAVAQAQILAIEAERASAGEGARDVAARVLAGMYGGTEPGEWPQVMTQAHDWARYALIQAGHVLKIAGDGQG